MTTIGTPLAPRATRVMLLGSGELGKEVAIELMRYGCEVIAVDRYANAPAMQVAHRSHVINMLDGEALIVPEIEAIATAELVALEQEGWQVVPSARAVHLTMNREGIRRLAAEELKLATSPYCFADSRVEYEAAIRANRSCLLRAKARVPSKPKSRLMPPGSMPNPVVAAVRAR